MSGESFYPLKQNEKKLIQDYPVAEIYAHIMFLLILIYSQQWKTDREKHYCQVIIMQFLSTLKYKFYFFL